MAGKGFEALPPLQHKIGFGVLTQMTGFLALARTSFPNIAKALDKDMSGKGWLWDNRQNKYIAVP